MIQQLFNGTAILGDCLDEMSAIKDRSVDMILCDLPYGITANKWDSVIDFRDLWAQYERIVKSSGAIVLTAAQPFASALVMSNPKLFKYEWIWDKKRITGHLQAKRQPLRQHEQVLVFYKEQSTYNFMPTLKNTKGLMSKKKNVNTTVSSTANYTSGWAAGWGDNENEYGYPKSILSDIPIMNNLSKDKSGLHPTQKPVALFEYLIKTYTNTGDLVLDNCAGSFTTAIACINTGRRYICIEKDENYYKLGVDRINKEVDFL